MRLLQELDYRKRELRAPFCFIRFKAEYLKFMPHDILNSQCSSGSEESPVILWGSYPDRKGSLAIDVKDHKGFIADHFQMQIREIGS